jgi:hypothetical protein
MMPLRLQATKPQTIEIAENRGFTASGTAVQFFSPKAFASRSIPVRIFFSEALPKLIRISEFGLFRVGSFA